MNFTVTRTQLSELHNAIYHLRNFKEHMEETLAPSILKEFNKGFDRLYKVYKPLMDEADAIDDRKNKHYEEVRKRNDFKSIWSNYEADNLFESSGLVAEELVYESWEKTVTVPLPGGILKWWDLYSAAEKAIIESGDDHHVFIESFNKKGNKLHLICGS